jgi:hypothetical protein
VKDPASYTESGFVPPELNVKENEAPPLANEPEPKGLVKVRTLEDTEQPVGLRVVPTSNVHAASSTNVMELGNVITSFESVGIA